MVAEEGVAIRDAAPWGFPPAHGLEDGHHQQQHGGRDGAVLVQQLQGTRLELLLLAARPDLCAGSRRFTSGMPSMPLRCSYALSSRSE